MEDRRMETLGKYGGGIIDRFLTRGKHIDSGKWIRGFSFFLIYDSKRIYIKGGEMYSSCYFDKVKCIYQIYRIIDPDTGGRRTDLKDKNGKWIFEGDICRLGEDPVVYPWVVKIIKERFYGVYVNSLKDNIDKFLVSDAIKISRGNVEIIGNIHDNPELLEVEK